MELRTNAQQQKAEEARVLAERRLGANLGPMFGSAQRPGAYLAPFGFQAQASKNTLYVMVDDVRSHETIRLWLSKYSVVSTTHGAKLRRAPETARSGQ